MTYPTCRVVDDSGTASKSCLTNLNVHKTIISNISCQETYRNE